ncbi:hypothetical protein [Parasulfitobacter algicola]|uniref:Uncharacterized protein n=1 Tax=Parasulfitobacter algicola TaxID=2614809 RepID=A0ABX2IWM7_9RHOB|nr:hypothetical protein [Sulfitobacter algicola]NSX54756.1 hypothetical protein [Sulfitobacter algicola]
MWKFFKKKDTPDAQDGPDDRFMIIAQLNARVQPMDRYDCFEEPLNKILKEQEIGEVTGGGTQMADEPDGIAHCDLEIMAVNTTQMTVTTIIEALEKIGAPKGSLLKIPGQDNIPFGTQDGLGLFLNGTDLPDEVYEQADVNQLITDCDQLLVGIGQFRGYWEGSKETALYFYGDNFDAMKSALQDFIEKTPLCERSRTVQIA